MDGEEEGNITYSSSSGTCFCSLVKRDSFSEVDLKSQKNVEKSEKERNASGGCSKSRRVQEEII